jgi:SpoU rRNA methylase family enzyme
MRRGDEMYIVLYSPTGIHKVVEFLKTMYLVEGFTPVIVKPIGAAAQIGVPEAHKIAFKAGKPLIVLPELSDVSRILGASPVYYLSDEGEEKGFEEVFASSGNVAVVLNAGDVEPSRKELENVKTVWVKNFPKGLPAIALSGVIVYNALLLKTTR